MGSNISKSQEKSNLNATKLLDDGGSYDNMNVSSIYDYATKQAQIIKERFDESIKHWMDWFKKYATHQAQSGHTVLSLENENESDNSIGIKTKSVLKSPEWQYFSRHLRYEHDITVRNANSLCQCRWSWTKSSKGFGKVLFDIAQTTISDMYNKIDKDIDDAIHKYASYQIEVQTDWWINIRPIFTRFQKDGFDVRLSAKEKTHLVISWEHPYQYNVETSKLEVTRAKTAERIKNLDKTFIIQNEVNKLFLVVSAKARDKKTFHQENIIPGQNWILVVDKSIWVKQLNDSQSLGRLFVNEIISQFIQEHPIIDQFKTMHVTNKGIALSWSF